MLCTVSRRAQPIHSFKLIIHLDDTVQCSELSYQQMSREFTYLSLFWLDFGIHFMLLLKVICLYQS